MIIHQLLRFSSSNKHLQHAFLLMPAQSECVVRHVLSQQATAASPALPCSLSPSSLQLPVSPYSRRLPALAHPAVAADDEDDVAELVALLARARLVPSSSRRPVAAMLCAAGIGSAEALAQVLQQDPDFLSNKVPCASVARHPALTRVLQLSLTQPQAHCLADYVRRHQARQAAQRFNRSLLMAASAAAAVALISAALLRLSRRQ